jgi:hypothetical protein
LGTEVPLAGGNVSSGVVRVGDTVRRPAGPWTPAVHALLDHLHGVGFHGAPRPLGIDEAGREVLTFVPGEVAWPDHFHVLDDDDQLRHVARVIREFHDAVADFVPPPNAQWQVLIPADGDEITAHHDLAPWNLILNNEQWTFIDWDVAAPGARLWDVAYAAHGFVPLSGDLAFAQVNAAHRLRVIADGYGLTERQRPDIVPLLARRTESMHAFLAEQGRLGAQPWSGLWHEGHGAVWRADAEYIAERSEQWLRALLA